MDFVDLEDSAYVKEEEDEEDEQKNSSKPVRRRARLALSCQRYVSRLSLLFVTHADSNNLSKQLPKKSLEMLPYSSKMFTM
jgi:hypothetical protein